MATHNGMPHLEAQIESILSQLGSEDELIIIDDASTDGTLDFLKLLVDPRIHLAANPTNIGHVASFEFALARVHQSCVILADQDDIWPEGRLQLMRDALSDGPMVAGSLRTFGASRSVTLQPPRSNRLGNILRLFLGTMPYYGSAMGFRIDMIRRALPFPAGIDAHDHWLGVLANFLGKPVHTPKIVTYRRIHGSNVTSATRRPLRLMVRTRWQLALMCMHAWRRALK